MNTNVKTHLVTYCAAKRALAEVVSVDEAKDILDKSIALAVYGYQHKDAELVGYSIDIKMRAERRIGELMAEMRETGKFASPGRPSSKKRVSEKPNLRSHGIDKNLADRARKAAAMPSDKFQQEVAKVKMIAVAAVEGTKEVIAAARAERHAKKRAIREVREKQLAGKLLALPKKRYGVILADPEWSFKIWSELGKTNTSADNHYQTSSVDDIKNREVASISADDSVLFLWATVPMLPQALDVMTAWGFSYKSHCIWRKGKAGTGYWFRNAHELLLVGTKGKIPAPAEGAQVVSVIDAPVGKHSAKPEKFYEIIESIFPNVPKIELNSRQSRKGWDSWGFEAPEAAALPLAADALASVFEQLPRVADEIETADRASLRPNRSAEVG